MTDKMTPEQRHRCMSHIRSCNTKPELKVRKWLWTHGYRYRLNVKSVPGKPDIVMRKYRTAIFVNGCFWHGHFVQLGVGSCQLGVDSGQLSVRALRHCEERSNPDDAYRERNSQCCKIPQTNREFWVKKIRRNQERDQENYRVLQENGWQVIVVWECQLKPKRLERTMLEVELMLNENLLALHRPHKPVSYQIEEETPLPMAAEEMDWCTE